MLNFVRADKSSGNSMLRNREDIVQRFSAAGVHLALSVLVAGAVLAIMWLAWFPSPYFHATGGSHLILILLTVDIIIGPLITLVIFNKKKKNLRFDLLVVALLQLAALSYGIYSLYWARPAYVVFSNDRFDVVAVAEVLQSELPKVTLAEFKTVPFVGPRIVSAKMPIDQDEKARIMFASVGGLDLQHFPQYYRPYSDSRNHVISKSRPLSDFKSDSAKYAHLLGELATLNRGEASVKYLPLRAKFESMTVLVDSQTAEVVRIVRVEPM